MTRGPGLLRFRRRDYLGPRSVPLDRAVRDAVEAETGRGPKGRSGSSPSCARSVTASTRSASTTASTRAVTEVEAVLAEVTNTPWGERHAYVLPGGQGDLAKRLHVSPFMTMDHVYAPRRRSRPAPRGPHREPPERRAVVRRHARAAPPRADAALSGSSRGPLPARERTGARADLRTRDRPEARRRPGPPASGRRRRVIDRSSRRLLSLFLRRIRTGTLTVIEDGERRVYGSGPPAATIHRALAEDVAAGADRQPWAWPRRMPSGLWDSPDLAALVRLAARNAAGLDRLRALIAPVRVPIQRIRATARRSTRDRSRRDIAAHYDLGNELFSRMLDRTMSYSCAVFDDPRRDARRRAGRQARADLRQARAARDGPPARDRHRLGGSGDPRRRDARLPRHHDHDLPRAARTRASPRCAAPDSGTASRCCTTTTAT